MRLLDFEGNIGSHLSAKEWGLESKLEASSFLCTVSLLQMDSDLFMCLSLWYLMLFVQSCLDKTSIASVSVL